MKFVEIKIWLCVCKSSQNVKKLPKFIKSIKNSLNKVDSYLEVCEWFQRLDRLRNLPADTSEYYIFS